MNLFAKISGKLSLLYNTLNFLKKHLATIFGLGLIAAFGRVIQLGGFGQIASWFNIVLEVVVEFARLLLFLYVLGFANFRKGASRIRQFFIDKNSRKLYLKAAIQKFRKQWIEILLNFVVFSVIAWGINYMIDVLAYQTC